MEFKDKYTSLTDNEKDKKVISDDVYALCELIDGLIKGLRRAIIK